ncbi:bifunctional UDP-N-acetylglucosamine diphosphorylase/glucosamine-1-phosphate N-acetyltransferase GlmU [Anabaena cylindrica FACHB-243]|uniref:Bifunctional protein GlmU n=1 Tax=Anabaena cylindrica (strain ATCC 27899 / PCC 7122) TaxID=272123 RepID=K9ZR50_ANACC|nr:MULTISPECIES: bifunctional UDP-N-acetylglucosamine diphosphorylase/glucosamine-1-phosphate N-acetyltransferase GlmU [Anabaena]AFZ60845.1 Bifunctional protein glmU [Anabaena cylindrica PCC 7122]MBD2420533.1 bifunctional UDP-N-acetylglucosamine diphosphorylase/glucosamine-1-phosphate N-acetyltransferase GlmU [Anabaena cylindrica FACHB-243]MBY5281052.1 bifunctional UDP-N-acetylglucosamine diphosphorylase/glucosamine-1-phosphate N-acetyltransferase GlmU [Anabaena sp. CCAP 1446/1C]MBY5309078.1 bi
MVVVAILAAGKGTRMKSNLPKVLHSLGGKSLVERVIESVEPLSPSQRLVIVGYQSQKVKTALVSIPELEFVEQTVQLGTGHAIQQLLPHLEDYTGDLLILNGDVPLLRTQTLKDLLQTHQENQNSCTILTAQLSNPQGYGRVFCNSDGVVQQMVEDKDCTSSQKENSRVNAGIYCFRWPDLAKFLPRLEANNAQKEYYLTDAVTQVGKVMAVDVKDYQEILGINDRLQLSAANDILQRRIKEKWLLAGVTLIDPASITIDETVELQPDVIIEPQTHLRGKTVIQSGSRIGPGSLIENSDLGQNVTVQYSVITDSFVQKGTKIGPYAHLRGHAEVGANCRIGNFVELKNTQLGDRTNVAHLSYLGDTTAGTQVNIGAGTITANYDGVKKHRTRIGDRTKTGSNSVLVAPITVGNDVYIAAGSTVTEDVANDSLVIARSRQVVKPGWRKKNTES